MIHPAVCNSDHTAVFISCFIPPFFKYWRHKSLNRLYLYYIHMFVVQRAVSSIEHRRVQIGKGLDRTAAFDIHWESLMEVGIKANY